MSDFSASPVSQLGEPQPPPGDGQDGTATGPATPPEPNELDSFFPAPPTYYKLYTPEAVAANTAPPPPNVDWIIEKGSYACFGEVFPVVEPFPTLEEQGVKEMFIRGQDRSTSLVTLLRAMLLSYNQLVSSLLAPPPSIAVPQPEQSTDPERLVEHIRLISINMHFLVNELRPVQARENLRAMMRSQIDARRAKTAAIKARCSEVRDTLNQLRTGLDATASRPALGAAEAKSSVNPSAEERRDQLRKLREAVDALAF